MELPKLQGREERDKKRIMVMELLKLWKKKKELWQLSCREFRGEKEKRKEKKRKELWPAETGEKKKFCGKPQFRPLH